MKDEQKFKILELFKRFGHLAETRPDIVQELALNKRVDLIPGGLADNKKPSDFPKVPLKEGVQVEKEHTSSPAIAQEIVMDHLTEDKKYYQKLKQIESPRGKLRKLKKCK